MLSRNSVRSNDLEECVFMSLLSRNEQVTNLIISKIFAEGCSVPTEKLFTITSRVSQLGWDRLLDTIPHSGDWVEDFSSLCHQRSLKSVKLVLSQTQVFLQNDLLYHGIIAAITRGTDEVAVFLFRELLRPADDRGVCSEHANFEALLESLDGKLIKASPGVQEGSRNSSPDIDGDVCYAPESTPSGTECVLELSEILPKLLEKAILVGKYMFLQFAVSILSTYERYILPPKTVDSLVFAAIDARRPKCLEIVLDAHSKPTGHYINNDTLLRLLKKTCLCGEQSAAFTSLILEKAKRGIEEQTIVKILTKALWFAACWNRPKMVEILIKEGAEVDMKDPRRGTVLYNAAYSGFVAVVNCLVANNADVNALNPSPPGWRPIHAAHDNPKIIRLLATSGKVEIDAKTGTQRTALFLASEKGEIESVRELLKYKPDLNCVVDGKTCLSRAAEKGYEDIAVMLLEAGTDPCHPETRTANRLLLHCSTEKNCENLLKRLVQYNFQIDGTDKFGCTALNCLRKGTTVAILQLLINRGASIDTADFSGDTPLSKAIEHDQEHNVEYLLSRGANANAPCGFFCTPIRLACARGSLNMIKLLQRKGADLTHINQRRKGTLFQTACNRSMYQEGREAKDSDRGAIRRYLIENTDSIAQQSDSSWGTNLHAACLWADLDIVKLLLERKAPIDVPDSFARRPIHMALYRTLDFVNLLEQEGAEIFCEDKLQRSALHFAVVSGRLDLVKYILNKRPELVNRGDCDRWTPLMWAVRRCLLFGTRSEERSDIIMELKNRGASIETEGGGTGQTWTAYKIAKYYGLTNEILQLVRAEGEEEDFDLNIREGKTYEDWCCDACLMVRKCLDN